MKFFPLENYKLVSPLKPEEAIKKLAPVIYNSESGSSISYTGERPTYLGKISGSGFEISRIIRYRNSFKPVIKGGDSGCCRF